MRKFIHSICLCLTICAITMAQTNGAIETEQVPTRNTSNRFSIPGIGRLAFSVFALLNCADALITNGHPIKPVGIFNPTNRFNITVRLLTEQHHVIVLVTLHLLYSIQYSTVFLFTLWKPTPSTVIVEVRGELLIVGGAVGLFILYV